MTTRAVPGPPREPRHAPPRSRSVPPDLDDERRPQRRRNRAEPPASAHAEVGIARHRAPGSSEEHRHGSTSHGRARDCRRCRAIRDPEVTEGRGRHDAHLDAARTHIDRVCDGSGRRHPRGCADTTSSARRPSRPHLLRDERREDAPNTAILSTPSATAVATTERADPDRLDGARMTTRHDRRDDQAHATAPAATTTPTGAIDGRTSVRGSSDALLRPRSRTRRTSRRRPARVPAEQDHRGPTGPVRSADGRPPSAAPAAPRARAPGRGRPRCSYARSERSAAARSGSPGQGAASRASAPRPTRPNRRRSRRQRLRGRSGPGAVRERRRARARRARTRRRSRAAATSPPRRPAPETQCCR